MHQYANVRYAPGNYAFKAGLGSRQMQKAECEIYTLKLPSVRLAMAYIRRGISHQCPLSSCGMSQYVLDHSAKIHYYVR